jgi:mRNA interferase MazF
VNAARQGEVWFVDLEPTRGREQAGRRPAVTVSVDQLGSGPSELAIVVPLTRTDHRQRLHVPIDPPNGGVRQRSYAMPEMVRAVSRDRLVERWGMLDDATLVEIARRVRLLVRDRS